MSKGTAQAEQNPLSLQHTTHTYLLALDHTDPRLPHLLLQGLHTLLKDLGRLLRLSSLRYRSIPLGRQRGDLYLQLFAVVEGLCIKGRV